MTATTRYAGFWVRLVAYLLDWIIVTIPVLTLWLAAYFAVFQAARTFHFDLRVINSIIGVTIGLCGYWIYEAGMESSSKQATLGKLVLGLRVTDLNDRRISFAHATGRHFAKYLSALMLNIGFVAAAFTVRKQAVHDFVAGTVVVHTR